MTFPFSIISGKTIHAIIHQSLETCVDVVRRAYLAHGAGETINPNSYFLRYPKHPSRRIIALPAHIDSDVGVSGIKWIASYPENVSKGFPRASAAIFLNDAETGYPFACLEGSIVSAARTAASAALAARALHRYPGAITLGIVGNGILARYVYRFLSATGWTFDRIRLFDLNPEECTKFKRTIDPDGRLRVEVAPSADELVRTSNLVVLTTTAASPYLRDPAVFAHAPIVLNVSLRDIAPEIILDAFNVVDDVDHVMNANTSPHLAEQLSGGRAFVSGTLADLLGGKIARDPARAAIFSPFGLGVLDLAVAKWVHDEALRRGDVLRVPDFFHEIDR